MSESDNCCDKRKYKRRIGSAGGSVGTGENGVFNRVVRGHLIQKARLEQRFKEGKFALLATTGRGFQIEGIGRAKALRKE